MHLVAARKANAATLHTLNLDDFLHLRRSGDPEIRHPYPRAGGMHPE